VALPLRRQRVEHALPQKLSVTEDGDRAAHRAGRSSLSKRTTPERMRAGVRHAAIGANKNRSRRHLRLTSSTMVALSSGSDFAGIWLASRAAHGTAASAETLRGADRPCFESSAIAMRREGLGGGGGGAGAGMLEGRIDLGRATSAPAEPFLAQFCADAPGEGARRRRLVGIGSRAASAEGATGAAASSGA